jgi:hypothetical protein
MTTYTGPDRRANTCPCGERLLPTEATPNPTGLLRTQHTCLACGASRTVDHRGPPTDAAWTAVLATLASAQPVTAAA